MPRKLYRPVQPRLTRAQARLIVLALGDCIGDYCDGIGQWGKIPTQKALTMMRAQEAIDAALNEAAKRRPKGKK